MRLRLVLVAVLASCSAQVSPERAAVGRALAYLARVQGEDGGFHSEPYGLLRPGYSLTAICLYAIGLCPQSVREDHRYLIDRAFRFLRRGTDSHGGLGTKAAFLDYPNYASAFYVLALSLHRPTGYGQLIEQQTRQLESVQLVERNGWAESDVLYGGFGLGGRPQPKPLGAGYVNLSVTSWVLSALRGAGVAVDAPAIVKARRFVERCQRFPSDGGFVFTTEPREQISKAGLLELGGGKVVGKSYGSTTADGVRSLLACGGSADDPRLRAAIGWLLANKTFERTPGLPAEGAYTERAMRFYYYAAVARAFVDAGTAGSWRDELREKLLALQRADGSWVGLSPVMKEDDPLIATPLALIALASCGFR